MNGRNQSRNQFFIKSADDGLLISNTGGDELIISLPASAYTIESDVIVWESNDGIHYRIQEIGDTHLLNIISYIKRGGGYERYRISLSHFRLEASRRRLIGKAPDLFGRSKKDIFDRYLLNIS